MAAALSIPAAPASESRPIDRTVVDAAEEWGELESQAHADAIEAGRWLLMRRASRDASEALAILQRRVDAAEEALARAIDDAIAARAEFADACAFDAAVAVRLGRVNRAAVARAIGAGR